MADPRNNADDAYASFMSMGDSEWNGLLKSLAGGGILQPEEHKGFLRARDERRRRQQLEAAKEAAKPDADTVPLPKSAVPDYSGEQTAPSGDSMKRLTRLVVEMGSLEIRKLELQSQISKLESELKQYQENLVPTLMNDVGQTYVRTKSGIEVELKEDVVASFPKDERKRAIAFRYLEDEGDDGIIKRQFVISYGRDSIKWANELAEKLREWGVEKHATIQEDWSIHHQSLLAYLREKLRQGANVPLDAFGAFVRSFAKIKGV